MRNQVHDMAGDATTDGSDFTRRTFLSACSTGPLLLTGGCAGVSPDPQAGDAPGDDRSGIPRAIDFSRSYLDCTPRGTRIRVRPRLECRCVVRDRRTGDSDEYLLGVIAKTGLQPDPNAATAERTPGYDYWIIFSKKHVYTRRTHTSSYFNNPTTLRVDEFGMARWHVERAPATRLRLGADIRRALEAWQPLVARTVFPDRDGSVDVAIEYPVKWADFNLDTDAFRVETGPVVLLPPDGVRVGRPPAFDDFQWAHLDYHSLDRVRCLLDIPTSILTGATFAPPQEHGREGREKRALTAAEVDLIERRLHDWPDSPVPAAALDALLRTDHYSAVTERTVATELHALSGPGNSAGV